MTIKEENEDFSAPYEELLGQINTLTVEVEIAHLEFTQVFDAVNDPLWVIGNEHTILHINRSFVKLFKLDNKAAALGKKCYEILNLDLCQTGDCPLERIIRENEEIEFDLDINITRGNCISFCLTGAPLRGLAGETIGVVLQYKDISRRKLYEKNLQKANKQLEKLVNIDGLTQIANRLFFDKTLQKEWRRMQRNQEPISLIMIDIDFFKLYNDNYGHAQGDECLKQIADIINSCMRRSHDLAARYGGEEFVCLLPETGRQGAAVVADTVLNAIRDSIIIHEYSKVANYITVSMGCFCMVPNYKDQAKTLIVEADSLLYKSKQSGRNKVTINNP